MMNEILAAWQWNGSVSEPVPYGEGHINQTYAIMVTSAQGAKRYILQKINTDTFKDPDGLMENICGVTDFLREKAKQCGNDPARATLHVVLTKAGKPYYRATDGSCWRIYDFVENTVCLQQVQSAENFYQSAVAFGDFQHQLADYPANTLHETIPHFHDTPKRFADFQCAVAEDRMGRVAQVQREIEFVRAHEADYHVMVDLLAEYEKVGLQLDCRELPDYLPLYLEYLSVLPDDQAKEGLLNVAPILALLGGRLKQREAPWYALFDALLQLAGSILSSDSVTKQVNSEERDDTRQALDAVWEEEQVKFIEDNATACDSSPLNQYQRRFSQDVAPQYVDISAGGGK